MAKTGTQIMQESLSIYFFCVSSYPLLVESFWQQTGLMGFAEHTQCPLQPLEKKKKKRKQALFLYIHQIPAFQEAHWIVYHVSEYLITHYVSNALGTCKHSKIKWKSEHLLLFLKEQWTTLHCSFSVILGNEFTESHLSITELPTCQHQTLPRLICKSNFNSSSSLNKHRFEEPVSEFLGSPSTQSIPWFHDLQLCSLSVHPKRSLYFTDKVNHVQAGHLWTWQ